MSQYSANPVARKHTALLTSNNNNVNCYMDFAGIRADADADAARAAAREDTSSSDSASLRLNNSTDSLSSFDSSWANLANETPSPFTFIYFKCAIPTSQSTCTSSFISSMCCSCGRASN